MQLKTSFFNPTLFKKNLSRSWPLWGGVSAVGSLLPLYLLLALNNDRTHVYFEQSDFVEFLYAAVAYFLPAFTICYAILVAMFVWSYLHNARSVGMLHSLAIDRTGLFVTNTLSGLAMLLIPYVIVGGLMCVIATCCGAMHIGAVLTTIAAVILENLLFFGMATLCTMVTGSVIATAVYYAILNFIAPALDGLIFLLAEQFIFGLTQPSGDWARLCSPVISLYDKVDYTYDYVNEVRTPLPELEGYGYIVVYGIIGIAMLVGSFLLYRARRSESAGDVVAFSWLRPVFRIGVSVVSSLTVGRVLYELFWVSLFHDGNYAEIVPMAVCMVISAVVGYYAASMLLEKSLRVFKGSLKGVGIVCAVTVALCLAVSLDLFGMEKRVPDVDEIKSVSISGYLDINCNAEKLPGLCEDIVELHEMIVADKDYIHDIDGVWENNGEEIRWRSFLIVYTLKNGSKLERHYYLPLTEARSKDPSTFDGKVFAIATDPEMLVASVTMPENAEMCYGYVEFYDPNTDNWEHGEIEYGEWDIVYNALQRDAQEGNFFKSNGDLWEDELKYGTTTPATVDGHLYLEYRYGTDHRYGMISVQLQTTMTHTLRALVAVGALDQATIDSWKTA
ncbi:MAG: hypothetical protein IKM11_06825 [Oscillospiraceae bacterium]|nr:hypothetical protein [Oscillospiraceae bacterium]